jgi:DHA2 family methylenomycin A resistance protein-like MFS transporter
MNAGLLFLPLTLALAIGTRIGAVILRIYDPFYALIRGHLAAVLGSLALTSVGQDLAPVPLAVLLMIIGAGSGITTPAMNVAVLDSVESNHSGLASGILNSARQAGGVIGVAFLGALLGEPATSAGARTAEFVAAGAFFLAPRLWRRPRSSM